MPVINKYNKSMIYTIRSPATEQYYIGSTTQLLCKRFSDHKQDYKAYLNGTYHFVTSFKILELGDAYIELLEEYECENRNQLEKREGEFIREHKNNCVNRNIAGRTKKEYKIDNKVKISEQDKLYKVENKIHIAEQHKNYYKDNKEKVLETSKQYYEINKEKVSETHKQYYKTNLKKVSETHKQYYEANKDKLTKKNTCECGSIIQHCDTSRHNKSKKHIAFINTRIV